MPPSSLSRGTASGSGTVAPDPVGLGPRHHQDRVAGKAQAQGLGGLLAPGRHRLQPLEHAQAVIPVDGHVAGAQVDLAHGQDRPGAPRDGGLRAEQVGGGDHGRALLGHPEAGRQRRLQGEDVAGCRLGDVGPGVDQPDRALGDLARLAHEAPERPDRTGEHDDVAGLQPLAQDLGEGRSRPALAGEGRHGPGLPGRLGDGKPAVRRHDGAPRLRRQIEGGAGLPLRVAGGQPAPRLVHLLEEGVDPGLRAVLDREARAGHVVQEGDEAGVIAVQAMLLAGEGLEALAGSGLQDDLGGGIDHEFVRLGHRALRDRVVGSDRRDAPLRVLDPAGPRRGGGEHLDGAAADGDLAGLVDPFVEDVAEALQVGGRGGDVEGVADPQGHAGRGPGLRRRHALHEGGGGGQHEIRQRLPVGQPAQHRGPGAHHGPRRRGVVEGQAVPFGIDRDLRVGIQRPEGRGEVLEAAGIPGDMHHRTRALGIGQERHRQGAGGHQRRVLQALMGARLRPALGHA